MLIQLERALDAGTKWPMTLCLRRICVSQAEKKRKEKVSKEKGKKEKKRKGKEKKPKGKGIVIQLQRDWNLQQRD